MEKDSNKIAVLKNSGPVRTKARSAVQGPRHSRFNRSCIAQRDVNAAGAEHKQKCETPANSSAASKFARLNAVTPEFCKSTLETVDQLVEKEFYNPAQLPEWRKVLAHERPTILASKSLVELDQHINKLISTLHSSHCQFVTLNDETYFFLKSLFNRTRKSTKPNDTPPKIDYIGAVTGGVNCQANQVRYVLDASPAAAAGIKPGDIVLSVNGKPYVGQLSFAGTAGTPISIEIERSHKSRPSLVSGFTPNSDPLKFCVRLTPRSEFDADAYGEAIKKSAKIDPETSIGYVHMWTGSGHTHDILEEILGGYMQGSKGLILDMRDGYGGAFFDDLDYFFRPTKAYPVMTTTNRDGKKQHIRLKYDKPLVALINGGSRSGKELLAYVLKQSGRGTLVGERTAGMVLAGRLFDVNDRCALYLAVANVEVDGETIEAKGVAPDVEVLESCQQRGIKDTQLDEATSLLKQKLQLP